MKVHIIAEVGSNWAKFDEPERNFNTALTQIERAAKAGADSVKFQLFTCAELYGDRVRNTTFERSFNKYALPPEWLPDLSEHCIKNGINFMCSAFSVAGFETVDPFVNWHKLASPEASDRKLVSWLNDQPKPYFWSDGCGDPGLTHRPRDIKMACTSKYPAEIEDYDLRGFNGVGWGLSDHTRGPSLAVLAVRLGCSYVEKHVDFCLTTGNPTPDTCVSISNSNFKHWVQKIRAVDPDAARDLKEECGRLYGRKKDRAGEYRRPLPEGVKLVKLGREV